MTFAGTLPDPPQSPAAAGDTVFWAVPRQPPKNTVATHNKTANAQLLQLYIIQSPYQPFRHYINHRPPISSEMG
jgi:hypothetical protein